MNCGNNNIFVLDFHHNEDNKGRKINDLRESRWSDMENEIKKCILLCKNCHEQHHYPETNLYKKKLMEAKGVTGCSVCGYDRCLTSLDFHHRDKETKKIAISSACRKHGFLITIEKMMEEIKKCDVICRNCHVIEHANIDKFNELKGDIYNKIKNYKEQPKSVDKNYVIDLFKRGMRSCDIAKEVGCANSTISLLLKRGGIKIDRTPKVNIITCPVCLKEFRVRGEYGKKHRKFCSVKCRSKNGKKEHWPLKEHLISDMKQMSWVSIGAKYNVTGNAVKYWARSYGLI